MALVLKYTDIIRPCNFNRRGGKDWLARCQDNVTELDIELDHGAGGLISQCRVSLQSRHSAHCHKLVLM